MTEQSLHEAEARFIAQLRQWQADNNGQPVARTSAEWQVATGIDYEALTLVRQSLRLRGELVLESRPAWFFSAKGEV